MDRQKLDKVREDAETDIRKTLRIEPRQDHWLSNLMPGKASRELFNNLDSVDNFISKAAPCKSDIDDARKKAFDSLKSLQFDINGWQNSLKVASTPLARQIDDKLNFLKDRKTDILTELGIDVSIYDAASPDQKKQLLKDGLRRLSKGERQYLTKVQFKMKECTWAARSTMEKYQGVVKIAEKVQAEMIAQMLAAKRKGLDPKQSYDQAGQKFGREIKVNRARLTLSGSVDAVRDAFLESFESLKADVTSQQVLGKVDEAEKQARELAIELDPASHRPVSPDKGKTKVLLEAADMNALYRLFQKDVEPLVSTAVNLKAGLSQPPTQDQLDNLVKAEKKACDAYEKMLQAIEAVAQVYEMVTPPAEENKSTTPSTWSRSTTAKPPLMDNKLRHQIEGALPNVLALNNTTTPELAHTLTGLVKQLETVLYGGLTQNQTADEIKRKFNKARELLEEEELKKRFAKAMRVSDFATVADDIKNEFEQCFK